MHIQKFDNYIIGYWVATMRLGNAPLVETILELKWELPTVPHQANPQMKIDPDYNLLVGILSEKLKPEYPFYERLIQASMPEELAGYIVQHRFRAAENKWPLVQVGPGILTLNETERYDYKNDFSDRIKNLISNFFISYPNRKNLRIKELTLRYIDSVEFDYEKENALNFIRDKMKINIQIPESFFDKTGVTNFPLGYILNLSYPHSDGKSKAVIQIGTGKKLSKNAIVWDTSITTTNNEKIQNEETILSWIDNAHDLSKEWFFKLCEGELMESFK